MPRGNTATTYGSVTKSFHWITALLIFSVIPLGVIANNLAYQIKDPSIATTDADIARAAFLFSLHKTIGVMIFFVALGRILWAMSQPKPGLLNGDKGLEAWAAETVHWLLYGSLVLVPLSGWIHHAATTGFAPIWWPFGQKLPFVPEDPAFAELTSVLHHVFTYVLGLSILAHIGGALKHHVIDQDATLRRMLPGTTSGAPTAKQPGHAFPFVTALVVWAIALSGASLAGWFGHSEQAQTATLEEVDSDWQVLDGELTVAIRQMGSEVSGGFADWTAEIDYLETADAEGKHGSVTVTVSIPSLTLGSVTDQAKGPDFFDVTNFPTAVFAADLVSTDAGHVAKGTLTIRDKSLPVEMPFDLSIEDNVATASGALTVDRRDFDIGLGTKDEGTLAFAVEIGFALTAEMQGEAE